MHVLCTDSPSARVPPPEGRPLGDRSQGYGGGGGGRQGWTQGGEGESVLWGNTWFFELLMC